MYGTTGEDDGEVTVTGHSHLTDSVERFERGGLAVNIVPVITVSLDYNTSSARDMMVSLQLVITSC